MTPQHKIYPDLTHRIFGVLEHTIIKAEQSLTPYVVNPKPISCYETTWDSIYSKEIICRVDLDYAFLINSIISATTFVYREVQGDPTNVAETATTDFRIAYALYNGSALFQESSEPLYHNAFSDFEGYYFDTTIAKEECALKFVHSNIIIDEDVDEEYKKHYYNYINNKKKSKSIELHMEFKMGQETPAGIVITVAKKIGGTVVEEETFQEYEFPLAVDDYDHINIHDLQIV